MIIFLHALFETQQLSNTGLPCPAPPETSQGEKQGSE